MARFEIRQTRDDSLTVFDQSVSESYKSSHAAHTESLEVFVRPGLFEHPNWRKAPLRILEFGFGLGTNFLTLANHPEVLASPHPTEFISCECDLSGVDFYLEATSDRKELSANDRSKLTTLLKDRNFSDGVFRAELKDEKIQEYLRSNLRGRFDVIFFDPFSPTAAPECWAPEIFQQIGEHANPKARLVTYSVSRLAKDGAQAAGFTWEKRSVPELLNKRNSLLAYLN